MTDFEKIIQTLTRAGIEFVLVGGVAATVHGSARLTLDVDVVYRRTPDNIRRVVAAMAPLNPYLRDAPKGLPFFFDEATVARGLNFTLTTDIGPIDLLGEIAGGGNYEALLPRTLQIELFGEKCRCLDLPTLIAVKRAAGRPKDIEAIAELEMILEMEKARG